MCLVASITIFYVGIVTAYLILALISAFLEIRVLPNLYIYTLESLFSYTSSIVTCDAPCVTRAESADNIKNLESYDDDLIQRDIQLTGDSVWVDDALIRDEKRGFLLHHPLYLVRSGIEAIIEDSVTRRFSAAELRVWNFLARNRSYVYLNADHIYVLKFLWFIGFVFRYLICLPCKSITFMLSIPLTWVVGFVGRKCPRRKLQRWLLGPVLQGALRFNLCPLSAVVRFHHRENQPKPNSICVANHTTPFDWAVLASDVTYAVVGQKQPGFFGLVENIISAAVPAVWFDRDELLDRQAASNRLKEHVNLPNAEPLLIFPEGTCINNTSVMKFKKGCFEIGAPIHPVAIRYDPMFADCFWNSSQDGLLKYTFKIMTSWAMVVDVWYLPPTRMRSTEDGVTFARRVQRSIAKRGGMLDMDWDGELKRRRPKDTMKLEQQRLISQYIIPPGMVQSDSESADQ